MAETSTSPIARIDTAQISAGVLLARVHGDIDLSNAAVLDSAADTALEVGCGLVLDLDEVGFIGSSGLSVLVDTDNRLRRAGLSWALVANGRAVARALQITGLDRTFPVKPNVESAVSAVESPVPQQAR